MNYLVLGLTRGSLYALIAIGYTMVYGVLQLINFAHSEVFMSGAFGSFLIVYAIVGNGGHEGTATVVLVVALGMIIGALTAAVVAWSLERVAYRPLRKRNAPKLTFLISAIGASFFLSQFAGKVFTSQTSNSFPDFFNQDKVLFHIFGGKVTTIELIDIVFAVVAMIVLDRVVQKTKLGRAIRATAEDAPTAALMGIDIDKTISRTFVIGGLLGGLAGFLFGLNYNFGNTMGFQPGVKAFAAAVLGGIGNIRGAMIGGMLIGIVEALLPTAPWAGGNSWIGLRWTDVVAFVVLIGVLMFRPTGLLGEKLGRAA
jgi:branched-chain amino acid transport system permease protein